MTTNVYDIGTAVVATDSRWSQTFVYGGTSYIRYLDDTGFEKIEVLAGQAVMMFAGFAHLVQNWKAYLRSNPTSSSVMPEFKGMSVCWIDCATRKVKFSAGDGKLRDCGSYFAGSGSLFALASWQQNKNAVQAVENAMKGDVLSGGDVKFFDVLTQKHNLVSQADVTVAQLNHALRTRGLTMEIDMKNPVPNTVSPLAANSDAFKEIQAGLADGSIQATSPSAPFEGMDEDWSDGQKQSFRHALAELFHWK